MHWEKIPLTDEDGKLGTRQIKEQLEELTKEGIPYRFVRTKELDGTETLSIEKEVKYSMPNCKLTEQLTLRLLKGQTDYKYQRPVGIIDEERFFNLVCRKTHDAKGNPVPLLDKEGKPVYYQLQYFLDSDSDVINEDQKQMLLQDPSYRDPATGEIKIFPYKQLLGVQRVLTEANGKEWLVHSWMWEGLRKGQRRRNKGFQERNLRSSDSYQSTATD